MAAFFVSRFKPWPYFRADSSSTALSSPALGHDVLFSCLYNDDALTDSLFSINTNLIHHGTTLMALHTMAQRNFLGLGCMHWAGQMGWDTWGENMK